MTTAFLFPGNQYVNVITVTCNNINFVEYDKIWHNAVFQSAFLSETLPTCEWKVKTSLIRDLPGRGSQMANFCRFIHYLQGESETHETIAKAAMCCFFNLANPISTIRNLSIRNWTILHRQKTKGSKKRHKIWPLKDFQ